MRGLTTKKIILILVGLLLTAAVSAHAQKIEDDYLIKPQSAREFLSEHTTETGWEEFIDAKKLAVCGNKKCDLDRKICMVKSEEKNPLFQNKITLMQFECVLKTDQTSFEQRGYKVYENAEQKKIGVGNLDKNCYSASNKDGTGVTEYCLEQSGDKVIVVGVMETTFGSDNSCEVIPIKLYYHQRCSFCFLMGGIFATADKLTVKSYSKLGKAFAIVLVLGLAIWIAMKTLSFVSSMTKQDAAKYITEMIKQSYKFAIAYFLLYNYIEVFDYIISPLLKAGLIFGNSFVEMSKIPRPELFGEDAVVDTQRTLEDLLALGDKMPSDYLLNKDNQYFKFELYTLLEHFVYNVNLVLSILQVVGESLICRGFGFLKIWDSWGLSFPCMIYGLIFWVFGFLLSFAFIFYVFDAIVQLGIVGALLPFLVASWPFKITSKWTSAGFKLFLNSIFTFMMMGMLSRVIVELVDQAVRENSESGDGISALVEALDTANEEKLREMVNVLSVGFCLFIFTNIIGFLLMGRVSELVNKFAEGGMKPAAPQIATIGASTAKGVASKLAKPSMKAAEDNIGQGTRKLGKKIGGFIFGSRRKNPGGGAGGAGGGAGGAGGGTAARATPTVQRNGNRPSAGNL